MKLKIDNKIYDIKLANNFLKKLIGLIFKKKINYGLIIPKCNSIHTFFMKSNIDVIFYNNDNMILKIFINVPKNKIIGIKNKIKNTNVLEMPNNTCISLKENSILPFEGK